MAVETTKKCISKREWERAEGGGGRVVRWVTLPGFNVLLHVPPFSCHLSTSGNNNSASDYRSLLWDSPDSVRSPFCQLQSGLYIKPHETTRTHYWGSSSHCKMQDYKSAYGLCTVCRDGRSLWRRRTEVFLTCKAVSTSHPQWPHCKVQARWDRFKRKTHTKLR